LGYVDDGMLTFIALSMYVGSFSLGLSTEAFVIPSEVFPLQFRAQGLAIAWFVNRIFAGVSAITLFPLSRVFTL